jgi:hypothetical protein
MEVRQNVEAFDITPPLILNKIVIEVLVLGK